MFTKSFREIWPLFFLILAYILIILYFTHGRLLVGGDFFGYYSIHDKVDSISSAFSVLLLILSFGNFYLSFYIGVYLTALFAVIGIYYLTKEVLTRFEIQSNYIIPFSLLSAILYLYNPSILTDTFKSFLSNVSLSASLYIIFVLFIIRFYFKFSFTRNYFSYQLIIAGIFLGLSAGTYPNNFRIISFGFLFSLMFIIIHFINNRNEKTRKIIFYIINLIILVVLAVLFDSYDLIIFFSNIHQTIQNSILISSHFSGAIFETGSFSNINMVLRLLNDWAFQYYAPYNLPYYNNYGLIALGFLWPVFALLIPLLLVERKHFKSLVTLVIVLLCGIFLAKGGNPPFGYLFNFLSTHFIIFSNLFGTYFVTQKLLAIFYPVLISFSLAIIYSINKSRRMDEIENSNLKRISKVKIKIKKIFHNPIGRNLLVIVIFISLLTTSFPAFTGQVYGQYFNENIHGLKIPNAYNVVNNLLENKSSTLLVLPGQNTYMTTGWGYQGASQFYSSFFGKSKVMNTQTIGTFGEYSQYNVTTQTLYNDMINLVFPSNKTLEMNASFNFTKISIFGNASFNDLNATLMINSSNNTPAEIGLPLKHSLNISTLGYVVFSFVVSNVSQFTQMIKDGKFLFGLSSPKVAGWYVVGHGYNSYFNITGNKVKLYLLIPQISYGTFDDFEFNEVYLHFYGKLNNFTISSGTHIIKMAYTNIAQINLSRMSLLKQYSVNYILIDNSVVQGNTQDYNYIIMEIEALVRYHLVASVYDGRILDLYKITNY